MHSRLVSAGFGYTCSLQNQLEALVYGTTDRFNAIRTAPVFSEAATLRELLLGSNKLTTLGNCEFAPRGLQILDVRDNKISTMGPGVSLLTQLERLDVTNNDLRDLPPELGTVRSVKSIVLDGNPMKAIRRDIIGRGTMAVMEHLRMRLGGPSEEAALHDAHVQKAAASELSNQAQFGGSLEYAGKRAGVIPESVWVGVGSSAITRAVLARNALPAFPAPILQYAGSLGHLDLGFNKISVVPSEIGVLRMLKCLDLRNNALRSLPAEIAALPELAELIISMNRFSEIPAAVLRARSLRSLIASDNQMLEIPAAALAELPVLNCLDLTNNSISKVPPELGLLPAMKQLKLDGNTFKVPRPAILARGTPALLEYLRGRIG